MCVSDCVNRYECKCLQKSETSDALVYLELQAVVSHLMEALGTKLRSLEEQPALMIAESFVQPLEPF